MRFASGILALSGLVLFAPLAHAEEYVKAYTVSARATVPSVFTPTDWFATRIGGSGGTAVA